MEYFLKDEVLTGSFNIASNYFNVDELMYADPNAQYQKSQHQKNQLRQQLLIH